jgi:MYXO-CTERM domain-containing protein
MRRPILLATALLALPVSLAASPDQESGPAEPGARRVPDVVGGRQAPVGKWDDAAGVIFDDEYVGCTGTLIAPDLVITAGHCIGGITGVKLGVNDWTSPGGETIAVVEEIEHPNSWGTYDVGVLVLAQPSSYAPRIIATGCVLDRSLKPGAAAHIVGYGAIDEEGNQYTSELREAETTITDPECTGGRGCNGSVSPGGELGAGGNGVDACFGDSGGPLYLVDESGNYLVGVTSRGYYDAELPCEEGGIWVRPDAVIDWIETTTGKTLPRATCNTAPAATAESIMLEVEQGEVVSTTIAVTDADATDTHSFQTGTAALHGDVVTDPDGSVHYRAAEDYEGTDTFTVVVADSGVPSLTATVTFTVTVVPNEGGGCGCRAGGTTPGTAALLALAVLLTLRRRRR